MSGYSRNGTDLNSIYVDFTSNQNISGLKTFTNFETRLNYLLVNNTVELYNNTGTFEGDYFSLGNPLTTPRRLQFWYNGGTISQINTNGGYAQTSDKTLKENIKPLVYGINEIMQLNPTSYNFISTPDKSNIGFIAQEVKEVLPELIDINDGLHFISMSEFIPVIVNAMKEQQVQINNLTQRINDLENK
jgi:hypothetical protein